MEELEKEVREALDDFVKNARIFTGREIPREAIEHEVLPPPHRPGNLPYGKRAVVVFYDPESERFLLIGLVGPNSNPRFLSQHYRPHSSGSNLARKLLEHQVDLGLRGLTPASVGHWMKAHLARINIFLPAEWKDEAEMLRDYLADRWRPVFPPRGSFSALA